MAIIAHFIDVGQGNMALLVLGDGTTLLYDCNVTDENEERVIRYLRAVLPRPWIDIFVNSHREADHMRGLKRIHAAFPILTVWDSGVVGGDPYSPEYREYMEVKRGRDVAVKHYTYYDFGTTRVRIMNAKNDLLSDDPNAQSIVMKVENRRPVTGQVLNSLMLAGDSDAAAWERWIVPVYGNDIESTILLGSHHGGNGYFLKQKNGGLYLDHIQKIRPRVTVVSVGSNNYGHPTPLALALYTSHSAGPDYTWRTEPLKIVRTDRQGTIKLSLRDDGWWVMNWAGPTLACALPGRRAAPSISVKPSLSLVDLARFLRTTPTPPRSLADILRRPPPPAATPPAPLTLKPSEPTLAEIFASLYKSRHGPPFK